MEKLGWEKGLLVSMENVDYMLCEHWKEKNSVTYGEIFKILPEKGLLQ